MSEEIKMDVDTPIQTQQEKLDDSSGIALINLDDHNISISVYASRYSGWTKADRLIFIASRVINKMETYTILLNEIRTGMNTSFYRKAYAFAISYCGENSFPSDDWADITDAKSISKLEKLETDLSIAKNSLIKEAIRVAYNLLGDHYYNCGNLKEAMKTYLKTREYCSSPRHNCEMILNLITTAISDSNFRVIGPYAAMIDVMDNVDPMIKTKIKLSLGIVALHDEAFATAAKKFVDIDVMISDQFNHVIAPEDVAIYGTILALGYLSRKEIRRCILENSRFKLYTELVPSMRDIVQEFLSGNYCNVFKFLEDLRPQLLLDLHFHKYVDTIYSKITNNIIFQYFSVYNTIDLLKMSQALGLAIPILIEKISYLITHEALPARIDSQSQTLHRHSQNERNMTVEKILKMSNQNTKDIQRAILRLSLLQNGFSVSAKDNYPSNTTINLYTSPKNNTSVSDMGSIGRHVATHSPISTSSRSLDISSKSPSRGRESGGFYDEPEDDTEMNVDDDDDN